MKKKLRKILHRKNYTAYNNTKKREMKIGGIREMEDLKLKIEARLEVYEGLIKDLDKDNKFKPEYEAKVEELKRLLSEMGC